MCVTLLSVGFTSYKSKRHFDILFARICRINEMLNEVGIFLRNFVTVGVYAMWSRHDYTDNFAHLNIIAISITNRLIDFIIPRHSKFRFHIRYQKSLKTNSMPSLMRALKIKNALIVVMQACTTTTIDNDSLTHSSLRCWQFQQSF